MNKDLDERLVPPGEYRDAENIEITTSEGSNVGAAQTLRGNSNKTDAHISLPNSAVTVATIADEKKDKIYSLISGGSGSSIVRDYIIRYDPVTEKSRFVFVDIYRVNATVALQSHGTNAHVHIPDLGSSINITGVRERMNVIITTPASIPVITEADNITVKSISHDATNNVQEISLQNPDGSDANYYCDEGYIIHFYAPRVLNFDSKRKITGINIIDDMLFWTDNYSEPKKVNISRSIYGTGGDTELPLAPNLYFNENSTNTDNFHTRLVVIKDGVRGPEVVTNRNKTKPFYCIEENITVIKRGPETPLELEMSDIDPLRVNSVTDVPNPIFSTLQNYKFVDPQTGLPLLADLAPFQITLTSGVDFRPGDTLILTNDPDASPSTFVNHQVRLLVEPPVTGYPNTLTSTYTVSILAVDSAVPNVLENWFVRLEQGKPLFEFKFPRFSYRYKYTDGEYSTFAPWSEIAFLPNDFDYAPRKGFNLGMTNNIRDLKVKNYVVEDGLRPRDVVEIDILYKETNSPVVYTVKSIKDQKHDPTAHPKWPNNLSATKARGELQIDSEMIHAVVPSNQLLRPWDNVPRKALGQEMTGNRIVYGNYLQNYNLLNDNSDVKLDLDLTLKPSSNLLASTGEPSPGKSIKSMRTYQIGVIYADLYGRETPVLADDKKGSIKVKKENSVSFNQLKAKINSDPPNWAQTYQFYIKETSNEYYNLAMDRWYNAEDGNIWLSFSSSDRNKVDEETFLILKKQHDNDTPVTEKSRYKILAIENEAPEFIKINKKTHGELRNDNGGWITSDTVFGNNGVGFPLPDWAFMYVRRNEFDDEFEGKEGVPTSSLFSKTNLYMRVKGPSMSKWYKIVKMSIPGGQDDGKYYKIRVDGKFGEDMSFTSTDGTFSGCVTGLSLEIQERTPENRPEFDGRFFVKIYKDLALKENLLKTDPKEDDLAITNAARVYYLDPGDNHRGKTSPTDTYGEATHKYSWAGSCDRCFGATSTNAPSAHCVHCKKAGQHWWGSGDNVGLSNHDYQHNFFIDSAEAAHFGLLSWTLTDDGTYSWSNPNVDPNDPSTYIEVPFTPGMQNSLFNTYYPSGIGGLSTTSATSNVFTTANGIWGFGWVILMINGAVTLQQQRPSRGLHDGINLDQYSDSSDITENGKGKWLDISFPFFRGGDQPDDNNKSSHQTAEELFSEGTLFRFQQDPDNIIYKVQEVIEWKKTIQNYECRSSQSDDCSDGGWTSNVRKRWSIKVVDPLTNKGIGYGPSEYSPVNDPSYVNSSGEWVPGIHHDLGGGCNGYDRGEAPNDYHIIEILEDMEDDDDKFTSTNPAIWETEPKEDVGLDIYYQASQLFPIDINYKTNEQYVPLRSILQNASGQKVIAFNDWTIVLDAAYTATVGNQLKFKTPFGNTVSVTVSTNSTGNEVHINPYVHNQEITLSWFNCYSFGNGVESDRIRDDFNQVTIDNGVKASTVLAEQYKEERRGNGLIYSGIFNSTSGVNNLNQFIQAEKITKDLNPTYGTIQKLHTRNTDLVALCEDKLLKILSNKDAVFNADGNPNLTATDKVLGASMPITGEFGISTNPESFVSESYRAYFSDRARGAIMRLEGDKLTPISDAGMKDWFSDNLKNSITSKVSSIVGSYDTHKNDYNVTITNIDMNDIEYQNTISFSEIVDGWTSFKSFIPENGVSMNNRYYTWKNGDMWEHHVEYDSSGAVNRNKFYGADYESSITVLFNDEPSAVKSFATLNYEGTQAKINEFRTITTDFDDGVGGMISTDARDGQYYNLNAKKGWYVDMITSDLQTATISEFLEKEGKWFNYLKGETTTLSNLDQKEFSVQGIGVPTSIVHSCPECAPFTLTVQDWEGDH